ncbi:DNA-directed RNA polymerase III subunit C82 [Maudiozyma humilis]|uniref:DNA-directed RNA polymerase III subunit RPC3 n=1 Tax=Maudiozyma humilis TaxID=51915 RepID=A0AAV5S3U4_MAUHU|nr:DNA-directed RNA polymerase III subunit C82 [Kazachstania humilis]
MEGLEIPNLPQQNAAEGSPAPGGPDMSDPELRNAISSLEQRIENPDKFLATELIRSHLGERAATIIDLLMSLGRLSISEMKAKTSDEWKVRDIKATIVSLLQLRCVKYFDETSFTGKHTIYYYYNPDGPLLMLYSGLIIDMINKRYPAGTNGTDAGEDDVTAAQIVQNVLTFGSISLAEFLENANASSDYNVASLFVKLCDDGFLAPISKLNFTPLDDLWTVLYDKYYAAIPRTSPLSDLRKRVEAKGRAKEEFLNIIENNNDPSKIITTDAATSLRTVHRDVPLTFNLPRFLKSRRGRHLVQLARFRVGAVSAKVYSAALKLTEKRSVDLVHPLTQTGLMQDLEEANAIRDEVTLLEERGANFNAMEIAKHLSPSLNLKDSLVTQKRDSSSKKRAKEEDDDEAIEIPGRKKVKTKDGFVVPNLPSHAQAGAEDEDEDEDEDEEMDMDDEEGVQSADTINMINMHLRLLANSSIPFLKETRPGVYHVPYTTLMPIVRSSIYDYIIASTLGQSAMRIRRCIIANSLVSEKVINSVALMREKDIRSTIASLIKYNVAEIQEVPRTMDRSAARAVFLFRSKESLSYSSMKQNLEWNIANLLFKKEKLKDENATLLTKANREDVKGNEAALLLSSELNQLKMVNDRELTTYTRLTRVLSLWELFKFYI